MLTYLVGEWGGCRNADLQKYMNKIINEIFPNCSEMHTVVTFFLLSGVHARRSSLLRCVHS